MRLLADGAAAGVKRGTEWADVTAAAAHLWPNGNHDVADGIDDGEDHSDDGQPSVQNRRHWLERLVAAIARTMSQCQMGKPPSMLPSKAKRALLGQRRR